MGRLFRIKKGTGTFYIDIFSTTARKRRLIPLYTPETTHDDRSTAQITSGTTPFAALQPAKSFQQRFFWSGEMILERGTHFRQTHCHRAMSRLKTRSFGRSAVGRWPRCRRSTHGSNPACPPTPTSNRPQDASGPATRPCGHRTDTVPVGNIEIISWI